MYKLNLPMDIVLGKDEKILRAQTQPVEKVTPEIRQLIRQMKIKMKQADGIGLAAPQVGVGLRIFVIDRKHLECGDEIPEAYINPEIISLSGKNIEIEEGCLSLPRLYGKAKRKERIILSALDELGKKVKIRAEGMLAIVFQHELDHLQGILFIDKCKEVKEFTKEELRRAKK